MRITETFKGTAVGWRYSVRLMSAMAVYALVFYVGRPLVAHGPDAARMLVAVLLSLSTLGAVAAVALYLVEEPDEYVRMRQVQAVLGGTGLTLAVYTLWGYLAVYGFAAPLPAYDIFPVFSMCWLVSLGVRRLLGR